jgi:hypothetical protein
MHSLLRRTQYSVDKIQVHTEIDSLWATGKCKTEVAEGGYFLKRPSPYGAFMKRPFNIGQNGVKWDQADLGRGVIEIQRYIYKY